jgi:hypothetical protein
MGKGGGGSSTQTIQKADPWIGIQPALSELYSSALNEFRSGRPQYFPGQTLAGQAPETTTALTQGTARATQGSPLLRYAASQNAGTTSGNFLNANPSNRYFAPAASGAFVGSNPFLDRMFSAATEPMVQQYSRAIAPSIASQFSSAGRFGSGLHSQALADAAQPLGQALATAGANIYGGAYEQERARQQQAAQFLGNNYSLERGLQQQATQFAPQLAAADYADLDKLMGIGQYRQASTQDQINADIARHNFAQTTQQQKLGQLNALLSGGIAGLSGQTSNTESSGNPRNPFTGAMGGASALTGLGSALGGSGAGGIIGGMAGLPGLIIGGLLGGLFG